MTDMEWMQTSGQFFSDVYALPTARSLPSSASYRLSQRFLHILTDSGSDRVFSPQTIDILFPFIPRRLGFNLALDAAVVCLCTMYGSLVIGDRPSRETCAKYVAALGVLRSFLDDQLHRHQLETICASVIMQICEVREPHDTIALKRW